MKLTMVFFFAFFFFNDTATTEIYTLSLHDALPIARIRGRYPSPCSRRRSGREAGQDLGLPVPNRTRSRARFAWQDADRGGGRNHTTGQANPLEVAPREGFPPCRNRDLGAAQFPSRQHRCQ